VGRRLRTRDELLGAWRHEAELAAAGAHERAEAEAAIRIDANDPLRGATPLTPNAIIRLWADETLHVQLAPDDEIPPAIRAAFARAQALLWDGEPIPDAAVLVDEPPAAHAQH
jgi:hypothetical protein